MEENLISHTVELHHLVEVVVTILDARDPYTFEHSWRVATMCECIGEKLDMPAQWKDVLHIAAHLHDIGKVGVPDYVLNKPGPLTGIEYRQIQAHPVIGQSIINKLPILEEISLYVRHHHERWDGAGYPDGLKGKAIPFGARIIAVADTFDAITTERPYRRPSSHEEAFAELHRVKGKQLCPEACEATLDFRDEIRARLAQATIEIAQRIGINR
jgi:HD-GYP domain-containing protein (c-di-GMP phosphodiesterase class II)